MVIHGIKKWFKASKEVEQPPILEKNPEEESFRKLQEEINQQALKRFAEIRRLFKNPSLVDVVYGVFDFEPVHINGLKVLLTNSQGGNQKSYLDFYLKEAPSIYVGSYIAEEGKGVRKTYREKSAKDLVDQTYKDLVAKARAEKTTERKDIENRIESLTLQYVSNSE